MRSRALYLLSIFLMFTLVACSKKPADTASNSASQDMAAPSNAAGGNAMSSSPGASATSAPAAPEPQPLVVPAGETLTVRLGESVGSKISSPGQSFSATLASPVTVDGNTVIPAGAAARGAKCELGRAAAHQEGGDAAAAGLRLSAVGNSDSGRQQRRVARQRAQRMAGAGTSMTT